MRQSTCQISGGCAGSISKGDLKAFLAWAAEHLGYTELAAIGEATPTAELEPLREGQAPQTDEQVLSALAHKAMLRCGTADSMLDPATEAPACRASMQAEQLTGL